MSAETTDTRFLATPLLNEAVDKADEAMRQIAATRIDLGTATLTYTGAIALSLAPRLYRVAAPKAKVGDRVYVHRLASIVGVSIDGTAFVPAAGFVDVACVIPAVAIGAKLEIPIQMIALRSA